MQVLNNLAQAQSEILGIPGLTLDWPCQTTNDDNLKTRQREMIIAMQSLDESLNKAVGQQGKLIKELIDLDNRANQHQQTLMRQLQKVVNHLVLVNLKIRSITSESLASCSVAHRLLLEHLHFNVDLNQFTTHNHLLSYYAMAQPDIQDNSNNPPNKDPWCGSPNRYNPFPVGSSR